MKTLQRTDKRILILLVILLIGLSTVTIRLFFLQVARAADYRRIADMQRLETVDLPARRGAILDRNGEVLVDSREAETVYATPYQIKDAKRTAEKVAPLLSLPPAKVEKLLRSKSGFVYLARKIDPQVAMRLRKVTRDEKIDGVGFIRETKRYYPFDSIGSQVIGFSDIDDKGLTGIELYYDSLLKGKPGKLLAERDPQGHEIPGGLTQLEPPVDGHSVRLTIDKDIQYKAQVEIQNAVKEFKASAGTVIVMNPKNGEVYAMASAPTFNPNDDSAAKPELVRNRAITDMYEPGSTMKVFTASAALEERLFSADNTLYLPSHIEVGGRVIGEAHEREARAFTFSEIIQESSNVGAVTIGLKLGKSKLCKYVDRFELTKSTLVDLPGEAVGYMPPAEDWSASTIGNIPFGQGITVTPIGILRSFSSIANDGLLPNPHLLIEATDKNGKVVKEYRPKPEKRAISPDTVGRMRDILEKVVTDGTGGRAAVNGYRVAGKTGTAQKPKPGMGYASGAYIGSFLGYLPSRDPQIAVIVIIDEPTTAIYGGVVAAPAFSRIAEYSLRHLRVPPQ
ncbi:MAG: penicillin-binding protein 2 [Actinobacteria bacterium]|nr:penicillin-binding protein 2 [Actinomycetota bacterium]